MLLNETEIKLLSLKRQCLVKDFIINKNITEDFYLKEMEKYDKMMSEHLKELSKQKIIEKQREGKQCVL